MKQTFKLYKFLLATVAIVMFLTASTFMLNSNRVFAYAEEATTYFAGTASIAFENDNVVATVDDGETLSFKNVLVANELKIVTSSQNITKTTMTFTTYFDNEERVVDVTGKNEITFTVLDNKLTVNQTEFEVEYCDKCLIKDLTFNFEAQSNATYQIISVDQAYISSPEGLYKQGFKLTSGKPTFALPRIMLSQTNAVRTQTGYKFYAYAFVESKLDYNSYSILEGSKSASSVDLKLAKASEGSQIYLSNEERPRTVIFKTANDNKVAVMYKNSVCEVYEFEILDKDTLDDTTAPIYLPASENALDDFKQELQDAVESIEIGDSLSIPSMSRLVVDDYTSYDKLSYTVYYKTPSTDTSTNSFEIPTDRAGKYEFAVVFKDQKGNSMELAEVYPDDWSDVEGRKYVFSFEILDKNTQLEIKSIAQDNGYVDAKYKFSAFTVVGAEHTLSYDLYYNKNVNASCEIDGWENSWIRIPLVNEVSQSSSFASGFDYEDIQDINYDGELTFTPDRVGKYAIKCTVKSVNSVNSTSLANSVVISEKVDTVKPYDHWVENNVWSLVFLGVGTLCLIGIIILLFINPKAKTEEQVKDN